ncbi:MAG: hypothetical protein OXP71_00005, partial [Candidatus Poribacteria bacterium]|nr:hypothetical protein [Candidatus Poribacteria bacterium]
MPRLRGVLRSGARKISIARDSLSPWLTVQLILFGCFIPACGSWRSARQDAAPTGRVEERGKEDLYRTGFTIALANRSFDPIRLPDPRRQVVAISAARCRAY